MSRELIVAAGQSALVVVDMQNDFCHPDGYFARHQADLNAIGLDPRLIQMAVPRVKELLHAARAAGLYIVHTRTIRFADSFNSVTALHRIIPDTYTAYAEPGESPPVTPDSWGAATIDDLAPAVNEYVVTKRGFSAFFNTDLELVLRRRNIRTVILAGTVSYVCVLHTAFDAHVRDFDVIVASDATASWEASLQLPVTRIVDLILGRSAMSGDLIQAMQAVTKTSAR